MTLLFDCAANDLERMGVGFELSLEHGLIQFKAGLGKLNQLVFVQLIDQPRRYGIAARPGPESENGWKSLEQIFVHDQSPLRFSGLRGPASDVVNRNIESLRQAGGVRLGAIWGPGEVTFLKGEKITLALL
jgi:hypothetical protein